MNEESGIPFLPKELANQLPQQEGSSLLKVASIRSSQIDNYDGDTIPPDFNISKMHGKAKRVYKFEEEKDNHEHHDHEEGETCPRCPCCGLKEHGDKLPLLCSISDFYHLGSGYALYFNFLRYTIGLLIVLFGISGVYNLLSNVAGRDCPSMDNFCDGGAVIDMSLANKRDDKNIMTGQVVLNLGVVLCIIVVFHLIRYRLRKVAIDADDQAVTPADYTVYVSGISDTATDEEITSYIEGLSSTEQPVKVYKITRACKIEGFAQMEYQKDALLKERKSTQDQDRRIMIDKEVKEILDKWNERFDGKTDKYTDKAFISLTHAIMADFLIKKFKKARGNLLRRVNPFGNEFRHWNGRKIYLERAAEPDDVLWENLGYSNAQRLKNKAVTLVASLVILIASFFAILGLYSAQEHVNDNPNHNEYLSLGLYYGTSVLICVINTILSTTIRILAGFEKCATKTGYLTAIARKQSIALVINTAFTSLLVQIALGASKNGGYIGSIKALNIFGQKGLIEGMFSVFVINAIYTPLYDIFDPFYFLKRVQQVLAVRKGEDVVMTQEEANALFEGTESNLSLKYSSLIKTILLTCFYAPAMPVAILITIAGLCLSYWVDKYMLLNRNALPTSLGDELSTTMIEYLEWMCLTFSAGNIMFLFTLTDSSGNPAVTGVFNVILWLTFAISLVHVFLPMELINETIFPINDEVTETSSYEVAKEDFITDYDTQNPVTRAQVVKQLIKLSKENHEQSVKKIKRMLTTNKNVKNNFGLYFAELINRDDEEDTKQENEQEREETETKQNNNGDEAQY